MLVCERKAEKSTPVYFTLSQSNMKVVAVLFILCVTQMTNAYFEAMDDPFSLLGRGEKAMIQLRQASLACYYSCSIYGCSESRCHTICSSGSLMKRAVQFGSTDFEGPACYFACAKKTGNKNACATKCKADISKLHC